MLDCEREDCPAHGSGLFPCWLYDGTPSPGGERASFPEKLGACRECPVYRRNASLDDPSLALGRREVVTERAPKRILESVSSPIVDAEGRLVGVVKLLRDVTVERKLEQVRAQFVEFITHELRTPLTSISGFLWLVLGGHAGELSEVQRHQLTIARRQCKRLMGLVDDLLDLSALETGHLRLVRTRFDLGPLLAETAEALRPQAEARGVPVEVAALDGPVMVVADRIRIGQVLTNLAANGIKYTTAGSPVRLSAAPCQEGVSVEVADAGQGVAAEELVRLFDKYYRAHGGASRARGTGLGLAICKGIVEAHGGRIWAESAEGQGTRFRFILPPAAPEQPDAPTA
jgi:signal transduction histidine kinase